MTGSGCEGRSGHARSGPRDSRESGPPLSSAELAAALAVLVVGAVVRWELLGVRSLWLDEGFSLFVASMSPGQIPQFLRRNDAHPPGYYLLLSWWIRAFGRDLAVLRLPSFLFGVAAVGLTWWLGRRWCGPWGGLAAGLLVAVNPFQVYASNELRMYAPLTVLVLAATLVLDGAVRSGRWRSWTAYGVLAALAGYFSYFAALPLAVHAAWVTWTRARESLRGLAAAGLVGAVLYAPWAAALPGIVANNPQQWVVRPALGWGDLVPYVLSLVASQAYGGYFPNTVTYHRSSLLVTPYLVPLLPFAVAAGVGLRALRGRAGRLAPLLWVGGTLIVAAVSLGLTRQAAYPRNLVFLQPLAAITVAAGVAELARGRGRRRGVVAAGGLFLSLTAVSLVGLEALQSGRPEFDEYRFDRAAAYLNRNARAEDSIVYFPAGVEHALEYYLDKRLRSVRVALPVHQWDARHAAAAGRHVAHVVGRMGGGGRVWVVSVFPAARPQLAGSLLKGLEAGGYVKLEERDFMGVRVWLYGRADGS